MKNTTKRKKVLKAICLVFAFAAFTLLAGCGEDSFVSDRDKVAGKFLENGYKLSYNENKSTLDQLLHYYLMVGTLTL